jgi:hypothetical protein
LENQVRLAFLIPLSFKLILEMDTDSYEFARKSQDARQKSNESLFGVPTVFPNDFEKTTENSKLAKKLRSGVLVPKWKLGCFERRGSELLFVVHLISSFISRYFLLNNELASCWLVLAILIAQKRSQFSFLIPVVDLP